jgi:hypothetical protein
MNSRRKVKSMLVLVSVAASAAILAGCVDASSYDTRGVSYRNHGRVKIIDKTHCVDGDCHYMRKKVKHKRSGKTVVVKKYCDDMGNCYKTKHHHW